MYRNVPSCYFGVTVVFMHGEEGYKLVLLS